uniref:hyaluronoglucosaminidase n=1 Tax=Catharus ustulatus TaxID=91951 RepID=A0A8C3VKB0_CATUS
MQTYFNTFILNKGHSFLSHTRQTLTVLPLHLCPAAAAVTCPDRDPELEIWNPGHNEENRVEIRSGRKLLLSSSATVHSIHITDGGKLVIKDDVQPIILRTRHILIENDGELHIGSELCPYQGNVVIILYGRYVSDDGSQPNPYFGQKYLGVSKGGTLEIHGKKKLSWTFLNKTLHPGGMEEGGYYFERSWGHRGVIVHVIDPKTGAVVHSDRFDTYRAKEESIRLAQYLGRVANGMILSVAVNDEGSRNLDDLARKAMTKLGSKHFLHLGFRYVPALPVLPAQRLYYHRKPTVGTGRALLTLDLVPLGKASYLHMGEVVDGVDMRAEVGLLSRNVLVMGEMEQQCYEYSSKLCSFFDFDTFGGHIKIGLDFKATHIEGLELKHMGQQTMGHYPIHFHMAGDVDEKGGYNPPTYVKETSIHNTFSRCVTVHGSNGLLVKDVVGYDALGHCFFTEDGPEERNTFDHCLGLLVKPSTLLPSDRDSRMCKLITEGAYPGYIPKPRQDCSAVSTFWIANPHNNLINCAAAGSEETGFWFVLHHVPTGPSAGMYSPGYSEHMPMGKFSNNRAHSNYRAGMIIDNGVKTTPASAKDKRPILTLISGRYSPHKDADPLKPREPAIIERFIAFKNQDHGAWLRGGDVWLDNCQFADNGIGLTLASGGTFPHDDGSKQEIKNSLFVGESGNLGTETMDNEIWGPGGLDHRGRTLPIGPDFPIRGIQFYDGPINVQNCTFRKFAALDGRHTSALAFRLNNAWQSCPNNNVTSIHFQDVPVSHLPTEVFFGEPGPWFNDLDMDGDKTSVFHDVDGSVSEYPGSYLIKEDNWLIKHPECIDVPDWRGSICSGHFAQIYIQAYKPANLKMKIIKNDYHNHPLYLEGALSKSTHYQQYQPVITLRKGYTIHWDKTAPEELAIWLINFNKNDWIQVGFCYPKGTTFSILSDIHNRLLKKTYKTGTFYRTSQMEKLEHRYPTKGYYYWDEDTGLLFLKLKAQNEKEKFAFCSVKGCERIRIKAVIPKTAGVSDCEATAYPKYIETPIVEVPMPKKLSAAQLVKQLISYHRIIAHVNLAHIVPTDIRKTLCQEIKNIFPPAQVEGVRFFLTEEGIQLVVVDGHHGKVVDRVTFKNSILQGIPAQIENYVNNIKDQ